MERKIDVIQEVRELVNGLPETPIPELDLWQDDQGFLYPIYIYMLSQRGRF